MAVDLMQMVRAAAFTALVNIAKDTNIDVEYRLQAASLILNFTQQPEAQDWSYQEPDADEELPDGLADDETFVTADEEAERAANAEFEHRNADPFDPPVEAKP